MSIHSDLIAGAATPLLLDVAGETVQVWLKGSDTPLTLTALVNREREVTKFVHNNRILVKQRRITFTTDEASRFGGVAGLPQNATILYGDTEYSVAEKPSELNGTISVLVEFRSARHGGRQ